MLAEFEREQGDANPYLGRGLSQAGIAAFPKLMRDTIIAGNEQTLAASMLRPSIGGQWKPMC